MRKYLEKKCSDCGKKYKPTGTYSVRCSHCKKPHIKKYLKLYVRNNRDKINSKTRGEYARMRREKFPEKVKARDTLNNEVKAGRVEKKPCEVCGSTKRIHGHHEDYSKPLKVKWLCPIHHNKLHNENN